MGGSLFWRECISLSEVFNTFLENLVENVLTRYLSLSHRIALAFCTVPSATTFVPEPASRIVLRDSLRSALCFF